MIALNIRPVVRCMACTLAIAAMFSPAGRMAAQPFYFGADLSYVNEMEDCGAAYSGLGLDDPYAIFAEKGCNLVRLRLWHTPSWHDALNAGDRYSDLADVKQSIQRARESNMDVLLDFHLSDTWADPSQQIAPAAWQPIQADLAVLQDSLYQYVFGALDHLAGEGLLPDIVQIGNETDRDILQSGGNLPWSLRWPRQALLFNRAIDAVRDVAALHQAQIRIALHFGTPNTVAWTMEQYWTNGVQDIDIIGFSWYPEFHGGTFAQVGDVVDILRSMYPGKDVVIMETAYPFTSQNADAAPNVLSYWYPGFFPLSPTAQRDWLIALTQAMIDRQASGVIYWEPAWVSTSCSTQWAQGSHWDNATFFDQTHALLQPGGIDWMQHPYAGLSATDGLASPSSLTATWTGEGFSIALPYSIQPSHLFVYKIDGQMVWSDESPGLPSTEIHLSTGQLMPGMYLIHLQARGKATIAIRAIVPR